jgi:RNA-directed DNA polymerase
MTSRSAEHRIGKCEAARESSRRNRRGYGDGAQGVAATRENSCSAANLMEAVVEGSNMRKAFARVVANKGAAGVDSMSVVELGPYLRAHWSRIKEELLAGRYEPQAVLGVEIPKPSGGMRQLGIPTVLDRLIQQALHQVLCPIFDPGFSESSYGFRPGRGAHDAVLAAREHVASGRRWVVDMDLEKFFDRVNHDALMARVARKVSGKRVLGLIRRYLQAGMLQDGVTSQRVEGTPEGGPLSPLLSNILLDDLDKELERRGHAFCRYADDCNIYVRSRRAGERVLCSLTRFLEQRLRLKVNAAKSAVDRPWNRKFLGYSMTFHKRPRLKVAPASVKRLKQSLKAELRRGRGRNLKRFITETLRPKLLGWANYFKLADVKGVFEELDQWLRRKMRCLLWRQWKRVYTRAKNLMRRGLDEVRAWRSATKGRGPWWNAGARHMNFALPKKTFDSMGLPSLLDMRLAR